MVGLRAALLKWVGGGGGGLWCRERGEEIIEVKVEQENVATQHARVHTCTRSHVHV